MRCTYISPIDIPTVQLPQQALPRLVDHHFLNSPTSAIKTVQGPEEVVMLDGGGDVDGGVMRFRAAVWNAQGGFISDLLLLSR